jgi:hypothetical protein
MTEQPPIVPAPDPKPAAGPAKPTPAEATAASKTADALPKNRQVSLVERVFIVVLVVLVAVVWGMSSNYRDLGVNTKDPATGVDQRTITMRQAVMERLQRALRYEAILPRAYFGWPQEQKTLWIGQRLKVAMAAENDGMMPAGAALDRLTDAFLARPLPEFDDSGKVLPPRPGARTNADVLAELSGGPNAVTKPELKTYLAERTAADAYYERRETIPAVSIPVAFTMVASYQDAVLVDRATLTGDGLLPEIKPDDPEIQVDYEKLRPTRYRTPATVTVTVAYVDLDPLKAAQPKPDEGLVADYYAKHPSEFRKTPAPDAKPDAPPETKPLADVHDEIVAKLVTQAALEQARQKADAFDKTIDDATDQPDAGAFAAAAKAAGLLVKDNLVISADPDNRLALGSLGTMPDSIGVFGHDRDAGYVSRPVQADNDGTWMLMRLGQRTEAGFQTLDQVRADVIHHLQGQRVWKDLLAQAEIARAAAEKLGNGGLKAWAKSPDAARWKVTVSNGDTMRPTETVKPPPAELGQPGGEPRLAASLAMPDHPVVLAMDETATGDIPQVRLVQATGYKPEPPLPPEQVKQFGPQMSGEWRDYLRQYRSAQNDADMRKLLDAK